MEGLDAQEAELAEEREEGGEDEETVAQVDAGTDLPTGGDDSCSCSCAGATPPDARASREGAC